MPILPPINSDGYLSQKEKKDDFFNFFFILTMVDNFKNKMILETTF